MRERLEINDYRYFLLSWEIHEAFIFLYFIVIIIADFRTVDVKSRFFIFNKIGFLRSLGKNHI